MLAYTQTLIQQMDNRQHLLDWQDAQRNQLKSTSSRCCGHTESHSESEQASFSLATTTKSADNQDDALRSWFNCMWTSAKACQQVSQTSSRSSGSNWFMELIRDGLAQLSVSFLLALKHLYTLFHNAFSVFGLARLLWLARWRSPIVQRLIQSMLVQVYYIGNLLCSNEHD